MRCGCLRCCWRDGDGGVGAGVEWGGGWEEEGEHCRGGLGEVEEEEEDVDEEGCECCHLVVSLDEGFLLTATYVCACGGRKRVRNETQKVFDES